MNFNNFIIVLEPKLNKRYYKAKGKKEKEEVSLKQYTRDYIKNQEEETKKEELVEFKVKGKRYTICIYDDCITVEDNNNFGREIYKTTVKRGYARNLQMIHSFYRKHESEVIDGRKSEERKALKLYFDSTNEDKEGQLKEENKEFALHG